MTCIEREKHDRLHNFTQISNSLLKDTTISWQARGLLCELLSYTDDWKVRPAALAKANGVGKDRVYSALKELREAGYCCLKTVKVKGKITTKKYIISEKKRYKNDELIDPPKKPENPAHVEYEPQRENPDLENPEKEKPDNTKYCIRPKTLSTKYPPPTSSVETKQQGLEPAALEPASQAEEEFWEKLRKEYKLAEADLAKIREFSNDHVIRGVRIINAGKKPNDFVGALLHALRNPQRYKDPEPKPIFAEPIKAPQEKNISAAYTEENIKLANNHFSKIKELYNDKYTDFVNKYIQFNSKQMQLGLITTFWDYQAKTSDGFIGPRDLFLSENPEVFKVALLKAEKWMATHDMTRKHKI